VGQKFAFRSGFPDGLRAKQANNKPSGSRRAAFVFAFYVWGVADIGFDAMAARMLESADNPMAAVSAHGCPTRGSWQRINMLVYLNVTFGNTMLLRSNIRQHTAALWTYSFGFWLGSCSRNRSTSR